MDFIAIDFETANFKRSSACQIGLAKVVDNHIVETKSFFIKPEPNYYEPFNTRIHGINSSKTDDAPSFKELWARELKEYLCGYKLIAHNAPFEKSVFNALSTIYPIDVPEMIYDTVRLSRYYCSELFNFRLDTVCEYLGIRLDNHHNAEDDAIACANILLTISCNEGNDDIDALYEKTYSRCASRLNSTSSELFNEAEVLQYHVDDDCVRGKAFCFTGELSFIRREVAARVIERAGGIFKTSVSRNVDFLVVGDLSLFGGNSGKMRKLQELREKGHSIEILTESQFSEMVVYEGKSITFEMIAQDSKEFLEANRYNAFVGKNVCISEGFPREMIDGLSHRGASTGVSFWEDEASRTDFFLMSNTVLDDLRNGLKSPLVIRMESAMNSQSNPEGNPENHHIKFVDEDTLMRWFSKVDAFLRGESKMRIHPLEEERFVK